MDEEAEGGGAGAAVDDGATGEAVDELKGGAGVGAEAVDEDGKKGDEAVELELDKRGVGPEPVTPVDEETATAAVEEAGSEEPLLLCAPPLADAVDDWPPVDEGPGRKHSEGGAATI